MPMHSHTTLEHTVDGFLDQIEQINKEFPVRNLRWALIHDEQLNAAHLERMKNLGMYAGVQPRATIMGGIYHRAHGDRAYDMPRVQDDSGQRHHLGPRHRCVRGEPVPPVHDALVRGHRQDGRRHRRQPAADQPRGRADRPHAQERLSSSCRKTTWARSSRASSPIWSCSIATTSRFRRTRSRTSGR